jgi:hypothetical protein
MATVHKKLMSARLKLQSAQLKKTGVNKFAGFQYFELADFIPTIQQIFASEGLCGVVSFEKEIATLTITDVDDSSSICITSPMSEASLKGVHAIQNLGAVQTYLRRYLWVAALEIVEHDAIDASQGVDSKQTEVKRIAPNDNARLLVPADELPFIEELAATVTEICSTDPVAAKAAVTEQNLDNDQMQALWSYLDAPTRRKLKEVK